MKINFPGSAARQTNFTTNTNQSNESVTVVKINIQPGTNQFFFFLCDNRTLSYQLRVHRRKLIFTRYSNFFTTVGNSFNKFTTSSEFTQVPPCPDFYHVDFFIYFLFMEMEIHSINQMEIFSIIFVL